MAVRPANGRPFAAVQIATEALEPSRDVAVHQALMHVDPACDDRSPQVRGQAVFRLGRSKDGRALAFFEEALEDAAVTAR